MTGYKDHIKNYVMKHQQEALFGEEHCLEILFSNGHVAPETNFRGGELIIREQADLEWVNKRPTSFKHPIAQYRKPKRWQFRQGYDIVTAPIIDIPSEIDLLREQFDVMQSNRTRKVSMWRIGVVNKDVQNISCSIHRFVCCRNKIF